MLQCRSAAATASPARHGLRVTASSPQQPGACSRVEALALCSLSSRPFLREPPAVRTPDVVPRPHREGSEEGGGQRAARRPPATGCVRCNPGWRRKAQNCSPERCRPRPCAVGSLSPPPTHPDFCPQRSLPSGMSSFSPVFETHPVSSLVPEGTAFSHSSLSARLPVSIAKPPSPFPFPNRPSRRGFQHISSSPHDVKHQRSHHPKAQSALEAFLLGEQRTR